MSHNTTSQSKTNISEINNLVYLVLGAIILYIIYNTFAKPSSQQQTQPPQQPPPQQQYTHSGSASIRVDTHYNNNIQITIVHSGTAYLNIAELFVRNL